MAELITLLRGTEESAIDISVRGIIADQPMVLDDGLARFPLATGGTRSVWCEIVELAGFGLDAELRTGDEVWVDGILEPLRFESEVVDGDLAPVLVVVHAVSIERVGLAPHVRHQRR